MAQSRLTKRIEKQSKNSILLSILGIVLILGLLVKFGIPLLIDAILFVSGFKNSQEVSNNKNKTDFIAAPVLDALPTATNSAKITVSGTALTEEKIKLYINGKLEDDTAVEKNNTFVFEDITLEKGENLIQVKAAIEKQDKESDFSSAYTVVFKKDPPSLTVDSPSDNQSFPKDEKAVNVKGKTDPGVKVTVNNLWAIVDDSGNFTYSLPLQNGENIIKIKATDGAGNTTEKEIKVSYSP